MRFVVIYNVLLFIRMEWCLGGIRADVNEKAFWSAFGSSVYGYGKVSLRIPSCLSRFGDMPGNH